MQSLRWKFGNRRNDWRCCFCCHVRTGTIFIGVWNLTLQVMALLAMAVMSSYPTEDLDPVLPTPLSEVDNINFEVSGTNVEFTLTDGSSIKPQPLLPQYYRDLWERRSFNLQDMNVGVVITLCTFAMTLMLLYGATKGKPSYLMPFFCFQVFDFFVTSISAFGYLCYPADLTRLVSRNTHFPFRDELLSLHPQTLSVWAAAIFLIIMAIKAYFIGIVWSCYKFLTLRQIATQRTVHFIDADVQNLLPDLPDYETAVKKYPTPPPSYSSAVKAQYSTPTEVTIDPPPTIHHINGAHNVVVPPAPTPTASAPPCPSPSKVEQV